MNIIGIDPGAKGGMARLKVDGLKLLDAQAWKLPDSESGISDLFDVVIDGIASDQLAAFIEQLHPMPAKVKGRNGEDIDLTGRGSIASFMLGRSYGFLRGCLVSRKIQFASVVARSWQAALGCRSRGDKNVTKREAEARFPMLKITHMTADALLIAEWGRRCGNWSSGQRLFDDSGGKPPF